MPSQYIHKLQCLKNINEFTTPEVSSHLEIVSRPKRSVANFELIIGTQNFLYSCVHIHPTHKTLTHTHHTIHIYF